MSWLLKLFFTTATEDDSWLPSVPKLLALAVLIGAIGYTFTRPAAQVFDDLHDSGSEDDDEEDHKTSRAAEIEDEEDGEDEDDDEEDEEEEEETEEEPAATATTE